MNMDQTEKKEAAIPERAEITYFAGELQITEEKSSNDGMSLMKAYEEMLGTSKDQSDMD
jgi:hypothetical protein